MAETPMMRQYKKIKAQYSDSVLFFRLGDFYEMFYDDAILASKVLEITLTSRDGEQRIPMCGVPYHAVDSYIAKMIARGYKVALCDQVSDPKTTKGIVKREVTRVITPGTVVEGQLLEEKVNNYIASVLIKGRSCGLAYADISTGEFMISEITADNTNAALISELERLQVAELLLPTSMEDKPLTQEIEKRVDTAISYYHDEAYQAEDAVHYLHQQFDKQTLDDTTVPDGANCLLAAGALVQFLLETQKRSLSHITSVTYYTISQYMALDYTARRNLELTKTIISGSKKGSLLWVLDNTTTAMGGRLLKKWIEQPLLDIEQINARLDGVAELKEDLFLREDLHAHLKQVYDLERLVTKVAYGTANARDLLALKNSLLALLPLKELLRENNAPLLRQIAAQIDPLSELVDLLEKSIADDPPVSLKDGDIIKDGYHQEIDKLREASQSGRTWLAKMEASERERTGIKSLKIRYNKVFGYYIEVTKSNLDAVPEDYTRRQTLANSERFITPELKRYEEMILGAQDKLVELEYCLFTEIREQVGKEISCIQKNAQAVAQIDVLVSLADAAVKYNYVHPQINNSGKINITAGRHPVVELMLESNQFVPNDVQLDTDEHYIALITGPNMGGKSTYQRQVALIVLMAQMGSFVPATQAEIGIVDRIFARVGASDDLAAGHSTFMVEMQECNNALRLATKKSLVIIDELGRGTSNLEGMAIAQAVIEYLHNQVGCRTLFSTHYHELAELEETLIGLKNYAAAVDEKGDNVVFLYRVISGKASKSYGIHCARLAGMPLAVIDRANALGRDYQKYIQATEEMVSGNQQVCSKPGNHQLQFFVPTISLEEEEIINTIKNLDILHTTPFESLKILYELQVRIKNLSK